MEEKNIQLERLVLFSDAVVAIAITLLALDLRIEPTPTGHLTFFDLLAQWKTFAAFTLSFINIANFWRAHRLMFSYINEADEKLFFYNIGWLFFIVLLPFSSSLVSTYFFDTPAIFTYSLTILLIALFQNMIWDYASDQYKYLRKEAINDDQVDQLRLFCNLDMINAIIAIGISFFSSGIAFVFLFTKFPVFIITGLFYRRKGRRAKQSDHY